MAIYKFKVQWDENGDVERTILIKSNQTFLDFYQILILAFELKNSDVSASFFTSDDYWDKHTEITLRRQDVQNDEKLMHQTKISTLIEQPRQRFVFVYDAELQLTFLIELIKIEPDNDAKYPNLPIITSSKNKIPERRKKPIKKATPPPTTNQLDTNNLSDEQFDAMISQMLEKNLLTEDDLLNPSLNEIIKKMIPSLQSTNQPPTTNDEIENIEDEEEEEKLFDEDDNVFNDDEFNDGGYYDTDDEYEK